MLKRLFLISRPRFWMYCLGSFLIGLGAVDSLTDIVSNDPWISLWLLYFTLPANLFVYGINDLADFDTDLNNPKKGTYEIKLKKKENRILMWSILISNLIFLPFIFSRSSLEIILWILFILFNLAYSLKPIRLKAIPFLDSISNGIICVLMGILGYVASGGSSLSFVAVAAGFLWSSAMHAFSAIPDIKPDRDSNINTVATVLGKLKTLYLVEFIYLTIFIMFIWDKKFYYSLLVIPYLILIIFAIKFVSSDKKLFKVYMAFPFITYICGYLIYLLNSIS